MESGGEPFGPGHCSAPLQACSRQRLREPTGSERSLSPPWQSSWTLASVTIPPAGIVEQPSIAVSGPMLRHEGLPPLRKDGPHLASKTGRHVAEALVRPGSLLNNPAANCSGPDRAVPNPCFDKTGCRRRDCESPHNRVLCKAVRANEKPTAGLKVRSAQSIRVCRLSRKGGIMAPRSSVAGLAGRVSLKLCGLGSGR
jgi:hypothetical protein